MWAHIRLSPFYNKKNALTLRRYCISITATQPYLQPPFILYPFVKMYRKQRLRYFFTRDWEKNNKKHFQYAKIGNDINIKRVFQMEIDYTRC